MKGTVFNGSFCPRRINCCFVLSGRSGRGYALQPSHPGFAYNPRRHCAGDLGLRGRKQNFRILYQAEKDHEQQIKEYLQLLRALPVTAEARDLWSTVDLESASRRWNLTPYDAAYLDPAIRKGVPLATTDDVSKRWRSLKESKFWDSSMPARGSQIYHSLDELLMPCRRNSRCKQSAKWLRLSLRRNFC